MTKKAKKPATKASQQKAGGAITKADWHDSRVPRAPRELTPDEQKERDASFTIQFEDPDVRTEVLAELRKKIEAGIIKLDPVTGERLDREI